MARQERMVSLQDAGLQIREEQGEKPSRKISGHPIVFGVRSRNLIPWSSHRELYEVLEPGCITPELVRSSYILLNAFHRGDVIFGHLENGEGTFEFDLQPSQVEIRCDMPETHAADDMLVLMKRGDIKGMSFAFDDDSEDSENGVSYECVNKRNENNKEVWIRHVKRITALYDVSIVGRPAYPQTDVVSREQGEALDKHLREISENQKQRDLEEDIKRRSEEEEKKNEGAAPSPNNPKEPANPTQQEEKERELRIASERRRRELQRMRMQADLLA